MFVINENSFISKLNVNTNIQFNLTQNLNPQFNYYLIDADNKTQIPQLGSSSIVGSFISSSERNLEVFLKVNTPITGLVDIVPKSSRIDFYGKLKTQITYDFIKIFC